MDEIVIIFIGKTPLDIIREKKDVEKYLIQQALIPQAGSKQRQINSHQVRHPVSFPAGM